MIVDWVPAHFPKDGWALGRFDGTPLYEHSDPRRGEQLDWGTYVFDFGRPEVRNFLVANALYWLQEFHVDGLRSTRSPPCCTWTTPVPSAAGRPNIYGGRENLEAVQFLQEMNATVHKIAPGIVTIAEESTSWPGVTRPTNLGGLGFSMKWNMGWMHDTLDYIGRDPIYRSYHHHEMTFSMLYAFSENYVLPISHDEVVHGKGTLWGRMPETTTSRPPDCAACWPISGHIPASGCCSWVRSSGSAPNGPRSGVDWYQLDENSFGRHPAFVADLNAIFTVSAPRCGSQDTRPRATRGSTPMTRPTTC